MLFDISHFVCRLLANMYHESNFDHLPNQSNIYGITCIKGLSTQHNTVLVGSAKGKIFACEYRNKLSDVRSLSREVSFTYIPGKCSIISIDSFSCAARGLVIGVTFCNETDESFFNIYCNYGDDVMPGQEWSLDNVAQNCRSFALDFVPYQLMHCKARCPVSQLQSSVFVLLGGEQRFHVFAQRKNDVVFSEVKAQEYFSELTATDSIPTYLEIKAVDDAQRITAIGCDDGLILAYLVNAETNSVCASWKIQHDSPVVQIMLYERCISCDSTASQHEAPALREMAKHDICIVSAREDTVLYRNLLTDGFDNPLVLAGSSNYDCVTCCALVANSNTGSHEILVGTYGQKLLAYDITSLNAKAYECISPAWRREFAHPLLKIKLLDIAGDGVDEMVVITTKGVHILQPDMNNLLKICREELSKLAVNSAKTTKT